MTAFSMLRALLFWAARDFFGLNAFPLKSMQTHFPLAEETGGV